MNVGSPIRSTSPSIGSADAGLEPSRPSPPACPSRLSGGPEETSASDARRRKRARARGMTLIEIIVVITILGLIMTAVVVAVVPQLEGAQSDRVNLDIKNIQSGLKLYYTKKGRYPQTQDGLQALVEARILDEIPTDPWENEYVYLLEGGTPVVKSYGRDGQPGGEGADADISSARER